MGMTFFGIRTKEQVQARLKFYYWDKHGNWKGINLSSFDISPDGVIFTLKKVNTYVTAVHIDLDNVLFDSFSLDKQVNGKLQIKYTFRGEIACG